MKQWRLKAAFYLVMVGLMIVAGCKTEAQNKALIGGAVGAAAGQAIGRDTQGTLIGAGVGAGVGYIWGKSQDNKKDEEADEARAQADTADANTISVWITNSNGSQTKVELTRNPDGSYTGPKGERYATMPDEEQLKQAYGF